MNNRIELYVLRTIHNLFVLLSQYYRYFLKVKDYKTTNLIIVISAAINIFLSLELTDSVSNLLLIMVHVLVLFFLCMVSFKLDHDNNKNEAHDLTITIFTTLFLPSIVIYAYSLVSELI